VTIYWTHVRDFFILTLGKLSALPKRARFASFTSTLKPLHASVNISWHEPYDKTSIGYEAGWAGIPQESVK
jgi:hypothetical protein